MRLTAEVVTPTKNYGPQKNTECTESCNHEACEDHGNQKILVPGQQFKVVMNEEDD
jgi:hypothetical protein